MSFDETVQEPTAIVPHVNLGVVQANRPAELVQVATEAANALASVIESRKLYSNIQGKKFVRCEGWTTLAAMMGVTPHEISVTGTDGAFTATVELRRLTDGQPISRASAECGPDEPTWKGRARYARRSMALTRATAKACRLAFSWVMALSGYEVTPAEEMAHDEAPGQQSPARSPQVGGPKAPEAQESELRWKGKPLSEHTSEALLTLRAWCEKQAKPEEFKAKIEAIDALLEARRGE